MSTLENGLGAAVSLVWGPPLLLLLCGGGLYFLIISRLLPFRHFGHGLAILTGRYDQAGDRGQLSHYRALALALASTTGMGNISGVAVAIKAGGPGVMFWMWVSALLGMATKYFECSLAVMYRGKDSQGALQGGPMYVIREGLGASWRPLAVLFSFAGMLTCLPLFSSNQLTQAIRRIAFAGAVPTGIDRPGLAIGVALASLTAVVVFGGLRRISRVTAMLVPVMVAVYFVFVAGILLVHASEVPGCLRLIVWDAFHAEHYAGQAVLGSAVGGLVVLGARRAVFTNEAGLGTSAMAFGAARSSQPVHEGLVAMLGPVLDTLFICTLSALAILSTGVWRASTENGISLTVEAFESVYPGVGRYLLLCCIVSFSLSALFSSAYYGEKCFSYLFSARWRHLYSLLYTLSIASAAVVSVRAVISFIDLMVVFMVIPTMVSSLLLSPVLVAQTRRYFEALGHERAR